MSIEEKYREFTEAFSVISLLSSILIIVYIVEMILDPVDLFVISPRIILDYGMANSVLEGEIYRLFISFWMHSNIVHILSNLLFLLIFGLKLEELINEKSIFLLFVLSGLIANLGSLLWEFISISVVSVGASGAIFGLLGSIMYISGRKSKRERNRMIFFMIIFFSMTIAQNTNILSHLFGLLGGYYSVKIIERYYPWVLVIK